MSIHAVDLHGIDLNLLVAFDALIAERSVTRAGVRIGRTQPAMSAALSRLRFLLKDELFVRGASGLQPTPRALELAEPLQAALATIQRTLDFTSVFDPATSSATFSIALSDHPAAVVLPKLVSFLREAAPSVTLRIVSFTPRDQAVAILDTNEADLVVGVPATVPVGARILSAPLFTEHFVCVVRRGHPVAAAPLDLNAFLNLSHLLVSPEGEGFGQVDAVLAQHGLKRRLALTLPQMYAAPRVVAHSDMIATLMAGVVAASGYAGELELLTPPIEVPPAHFTLAWHRRNDGYPAQRWFRQAIIDLFAKGAP